MLPKQTAARAFQLKRWGLRHGSLPPAPAAQGLTEIPRLLPWSKRNTEEFAAGARELLKLHVALPRDAHSSVWTTTGISVPAPEEGG